MKLLYIVWILLAIWAINLFIEEKIVNQHNYPLKTLLNDIGIALASSALTLSIVSFFY